MILVIVIAGAIVATQLVTIFGFVLLERRQPVATLAWTLAILFIPVIGVVLYGVLGTTRLGLAERRSERVETRVAAVLERHGVESKVTRFDPPDEAAYRTQGLLRLGDGLSGVSVSPGNRAKLLVNAAATYRAILEAIDSATDSIHVEFYIIQPDRLGEQLRSHLTERAAAGLTVRVLCDAVGSYKLPSDFWAPLIAAGGHAAVFGPVRLPFAYWRRRDRIDFRNHRKLVIVDGRLGFTGGINVGREYLGLNPEYGHWRDTHIEIEGPAVLGLQRTFIEDWLRATKELLDEARYFPEPPEDPVGGCVIQIADSGPDRAFSPIRHIYFSAMAMARERLWVTSPYFVPDEVIEESLIAAALRGVDVRLLLPAKADHKLVGWASRSYYPVLMEAGVRIYEYARGFVHAKTLLVDRWLASVGSANMDIRSFQLNFELNAFVFSESVCDELAESFLADLRHAKEVTAEAERRLSYARRLRRAAARLLSPLL